LIVLKVARVEHAIPEQEQTEPNVKKIYLVVVQRKEVEVKIVMHVFTKTQRDRSQ